MLRPESKPWKDNSNLYLFNHSVLSLYPSIHWQIIFSVTLNKTKAPTEHSVLCYSFWSLKQSFFAFVLIVVYKEMDDFKSLSLVKATKCVYKNKTIWD